MINKTDFSKRLTSLRNKCGLSQSKLADMLYISGQAVSKWENASSLPDIELLLPLAQILGVSVDYLLGSDSSDFTSNTEIIKESVAAYDISDENISLLSAMSDSLPREYLYKAAKYIEKNIFEYKISLELTSNIDNSKSYYKRDINLSDLDKNNLLPFSKQLSNLTLQAINNGYNPVQDILGLMKCPDCGGDFEYVKTSDEEYISCGEHRFNINEGVVDFKTFEIPGYTWSSWIRSYDDYQVKFGLSMENGKFFEIENENIDVLENYHPVDQSFVRELRKHKPSVILDIGSGCASSMRKFMNFIDWECTIILTDLSHRILKYNKKYIDDHSTNSKVKLVYLACNVKNLPFKDGSVPCIVSNGFEESFEERYRVLQAGGKDIFTLGMVEDKANANTQKWLKLIEKEIGRKGDMMSEYYDSIYDIKEWHTLLKQFGFGDFAFVKMGDEMPAPDTDIFPYDSEISRWMGLAFVVAAK